VISKRKRQKMYEEEIRKAFGDAGRDVNSGANKKDIKSGRRGISDHARNIRRKGKSTQPGPGSQKGGCAVTAIAIGVGLVSVVARVRGLL